MSKLIKYFPFPPGGGRAALNEAALRRRSRGERLGWGGAVCEVGSTTPHPHPGPPPSRGRGSWRAVGAKFVPNSIGERLGWGERASWRLVWLSTMLVLALWGTTGAVEEVQLVYVGSTTSTVWRGIEQGLREANILGGFTG